MSRSLTMKRPARTAAATRQPVTAALDQGLVTPPQCMAVMKQTMDPVASRLPVKSIWKSFSRILAEVNSLLAVVVRKLNSIPVAPVAQMGRLILFSQLVDYRLIFHLQIDRSNTKNTISTKPYLSRHPPTTAQQPLSIQTLHPQSPYTPLYTVALP